MTRVLGTTFIALLLSACRRQASRESSVGVSSASAKDRNSIVVFAAASLTDSLQQTIAKFNEQQHANVEASFGASNQLGIQILEGAPADIFIAADDEWAGRLQSAGLVSLSRRKLGNRLVFVTPAMDRAGAAPAIIKGPQDLLRPEVSRVALAGENVPAGKYAEQALEALNVLTPLLKSGRIVRGGDVRTVLAYVERGEVDAGIVYLTDARSSKRVAQVYEFDPKLHRPIVYPMLLLKQAADNAMARSFFDFLGGPQARSMFEYAGFTILDEKTP